MSGLFSRSLYTGELRTGAGHADLAIWALVIAAGVLLQVLDERVRRDEVAPGRGWQAAAGAVGGGLLVASALAGPGASGRWQVVGVIGDVVHLGSAALWLGAFVVLGLALWETPPPRRANTIAGRASVLALSAVVLLAISGVVEIGRQAGSLDALSDTTYGLLLLIKSIVAAVAIIVALLVKRLVRGRHLARRPGRDTRRPLVLRSAMVELLLLAGATGVTATLITTEPAEQVVSEPYSHVFPIGATNVNVIVDPGRVGSDNTLHIYTLRDNGAPVDILEIGAVLRLPGAGIGPVTVPL